MNTHSNSRIAILKFAVLGLLLVALLAPTVAHAQAKKPPTLKIDKPANGATVRDTVTDLKFKVSNFKLSTKGIGGAPKSGEGYLRIEVNGALLAATAGTSMKITGYTVGANTIVAELMDYDRTPLEPSVRIESSFTYQATGKTVKPDSKTLHVQSALTAIPTTAPTARPTLPAAPPPPSTTSTPTSPPALTPSRPSSPTAATPPTATPSATVAPTPTGPTLTSALGNLSTFSFGNLQPTPGFDSVSGLNVGDVSLPTGYLSPTGSNLNFNYQSFYALQTPTIPQITIPPGIPTGPGGGFPMPPPGF